MNSQILDIVSSLARKSIFYLLNRRWYSILNTIVHYPFVRSTFYRCCHFKNYFDQQRNTRTFSFVWEETKTKIFGRLGNAFTRNHVYNTHRFFLDLNTWERTAQLSSIRSLLSRAISGDYSVSYNNLLNVLPFSALFAVNPVSQGRSMV